MNMRPSARNFVLLGLVVALAAFTLVSVGCEEGAGTDSPGKPKASGSSKAASGPAAGTAAIDEEPPVRDLRKMSVRVKQALSRVIQHHIYVQSKLGRERAKRVNHALGAKGFLAPILKDVYEQSRGELVFVSDQGGLKRARAAFAVLSELPDHALDPEAYELPLIEAALDTAEGSLEALAETRQALVQDPRFGALVRELEGRSEVPGDVALAALMRKLALTDQNINSLVGFEAWYEAAYERQLHPFAKLAELDALLLRAFIHWVSDFSIVLRADPFYKTKHPRLALKRDSARIIQLIMAGRDDPAAALRALEPANPLYRQTIEGLKRYRALAASGEVKKIPGPKGMKLGASGDNVLKLKKRLAAEGYFEFPVEQQGETKAAVRAAKRFGKPLKAALTDYQYTHQLEQDGVLGKVTLRSLNKSMDRRVRQIELSLQRWREVRIPRELAYYFRVNIPQFELEVWQDGALARKHRVVVGNTKIEIDNRRRVVGPFNYSRQLVSEVNNIILNPKWRVPDRITMDELELELINDPAYFENHGYTIEIGSDGLERVQQESGDKNALGRVKFNFNNPFAIYLHDTSQKQFFERTIRSFSHGCMRVHNALDLAEHLLTQRQGMTKAEIDEILESLEETFITLDKPIPIYVDYNSISVDEKGRMMFLIDIYHYDWAYYEGLLPYQTHLKLTEDEYLSVLEYRKKKKGIGRWYFEKIFKKKYREKSIKD